jgi:UDP-N-acetyl-D-galactosamine dehydrogenase
MKELSASRIGIVGLGYVGLPLAIEFSRHFPTVGYDLSRARVKSLIEGSDSTGEISAEELSSAKGLLLTTDLDELAGCNVYVITVPTPIDDYKRPDLSPLIMASEHIGSVIKRGDVVIYESTVYPGATEEDCIPIIEAKSGLKYNQDFFAGYSPERINPGDPNRRLTTIKKVTSGSTPEIADFVDTLYGTIISAGTHKAQSIRVAEAAKVIENTQRDVNIALINEFALIFERMGLNTLDVLEAAETKWNFMPFRPGLVGGHCIGVDPYYLASKAQSLGYYPEIVLAGRRINDGMGAYVAQRLIKRMIAADLPMKTGRVLILGVTFKENCPDLRNTRVIDIHDRLAEYGIAVDVHDPWVNAEDAKHHLGVDLVDAPTPGCYDAVILAVAHRDFVDMGAKGVRAFGRDQAVVFDLKGALRHDPTAADLNFEQL